jgi:hypothetical protein
MSSRRRGTNLSPRRLARISAALWLAGNIAAACIQGGAPSNLIVTVANARAEAATFAWRSSGLLGTGIFATIGTEPIGGCERYVRSFGPGHQVITVTSGGQVLPLEFDVARADQVKAFVLIAGDGSIRQLNEKEMPTDAQCGTADPSG